MIDFHRIRDIFGCKLNEPRCEKTGHREADLRLCFRICKNPVFSRRGPNDS